jgi:exonuclease SbcD
VALGNDLVLPGSLVKDPRLDYVALGHIHKPQDLNEGGHPPVIYPGSIERVDFGEAGEDKFFVLAEVGRGETRIEWRPLDHIRPFIDRFIRIESPDEITDQIRSLLPPPDALADAIFRLQLEYPREWEPMIDEASLRNHASQAFEFRLVKRPQMEMRIRLPEDQSLGSLAPLELLDKYWEATHTDPEEADALRALAQEILQGPPDDLE